MTIGELIKKLSKLDRDDVIVYTDVDGGWTNIDLDFTTNSQVSIIPSSNEIFSDD